jgi:hypothetical protein
MRLRGRRVTAGPREKAEKGKEIKITNIQFYPWNSRIIKMQIRIRISMGDQKIMRESILEIDPWGIFLIVMTLMKNKKNQ